MIETDNIISLIFIIIGAVPQLCLTSDLSLGNNLPKDINNNINIIKTWLEQTGARVYPKVTECLNEK